MVTEEHRPPTRRPVLLVAAWLATAALAIAISGWAVGLASRQVTDPIQPTALAEVTRSVAPSPTAPSPSPATSVLPGPAGDPSPAADPPGAPPPEQRTSTAAPAAPPPAAATTRTVGAVGGRASFRFQGDRVSLEWATPSTGFEVDVEQHGSELRVRFRRDDHESRLFASVRDGQPVTRVEERPDDDGGDGEA